MPIKTEHYLLEAFLDGDSYSALADRRRFSTIDNQLNAMSTIMGDGRIDGWDIVAGTFPNVTLTKGSGFINKHYVITSDNQNFELSANGTFNFYAQRRIGVLNTTGPKSNVASITYNNSGPPAMPTGFSITENVDNPFFSADLSWSSNIEVDFDHYDIERTIYYPPDNYNLVTAIPKGTTDFTDTLNEDTTYYYRLYAVDESGFRSSPAETIFMTKLSSTSPPSPMEVLMSFSEGAINVLWKRPKSMSFNKISNWELSWVRLQSDGSEISSTQQSRDIGKSVFFDRIEDLINGEIYKVTLKTIDVKARKSNGIVQNISPRFSNAPKDPTNITRTETELVEGSVIINTSWTDGTDEYDPLVPYRYNIYLTVDGQQESVAINVPIGELNEQIELYTFDRFSFFSIPQNQLITLRYTSLTQNGIESSGNYARFITQDFRQTLPISSLNAVFDSATGKITITWINPSDTFDIKINIADDDLNDDYTPITIIDKSIGLVETFIFNAELSHIYTITVTPFNSNSVAGVSDIVVETTLIPGGLSAPSFPASIFPKSGDRQNSFSWMASTNIGVVSYKIYNRIGPISFVSSDWELLDTVPNTITQFEHFGLENDQIYSYYITAVNLHGQESAHLPDGMFNLNFFGITPKASGIITEPSSITLSLIGNDISITWNTLLEEFDAFTIYRSIGNLHLWQTIATVDRNTTAYLDEDIPLVDDTTFYYSIGKTVNDSDIVVQTSDVSPESSIFLGEITLGESTFSTPDSSSRREIRNLIDPISEYADTYVLKHVHKGLSRFDPERIDLNSELIVTDWETVDGRIFTTSELDITGTGYVVKINGRFPPVLFEVDPITRRIIFTETIVAVDEFGTVIGTLPDIELRVLGVEETQGILDISHFDRIHARQVAFGRINKEQIQSINHEGRIREKMLPKTYLLERFSNQTFIVPQGNTDNTKIFGNGTSFFSVIESDGLIEEIIDWDLEDNEAMVGFKPPLSSITTVDNMLPSLNIAEVTGNISFQSEKSYHFAFEFIDSNESRWVRLITTDTAKKPNPLIDLKKRLKFKIFLDKGSLYLTLGVRETLNSGIIGSNGGTTGAIEWIGVSETLKDNNGNDVPIGILIEPKNTWQEVEFDLEKDDIFPFSDDADGILNGDFGVLDHIACTVNPSNPSPDGIYHLYIDKLEQVDDVLVSGTSQGIQISRNFGSSWNVVRLVETPVHKFYRGVNNSFLWAVAANTVLIASDPANWFETSGLTGVQYIRDIVEDAFGNMFVSTDKGVYWFETALINNFSGWRQTQPVTAFTTDCYGMYHEPVASGIDEIWVSTEIGIYKTRDRGITWTDTGMKTEGLPVFEFLNIGSGTSNVVAITRKHVVRKLGSETDFSVLANFEVQHNIFDIWTMEFFAGYLYISTGKGVFRNSISELFIPNINIIFDQIFPGLNVNGKMALAFCLNAVQISSKEYQLFIGQENRLMTSDSNGVLSVKEQFKNKELPSFFSDDNEILSGYVYNAFNNVLNFREPQPIDVFYSASNLPRKIYLPINGGWTQTNPSTDVFIFVNGIPKWLDFKLNESDISGELQLLREKLSPIIGTLTAFNSLSPNAADTLSSVLEDITNIISGGEDGVSLINNTTIIKFLEDHTRFLSLITKTVIDANNLDVLPPINIAGFSASQRVPGSRAGILETRDEFTANNSTGINIDTLAGKVDFLTVFTQATDLEAKQEFVFNKYDNLEITIFNANVANTGEFTHIELENKMEAVNTGLSSCLSRYHYTNLIKTGIFLESKHNFLFDRFNASNIQSKFNAAHTNDWYSVKNSTVDYKLLLKVDDAPESKFANDVAIFLEDPYLEDRIWIATDNDILQYKLNTMTGTLSVEKNIRPGNGAISLFIWQIFVLTEDDIYVVAEEKSSKVGHIFRTVDSGFTWTDLETINLPQQIYNFSILNGNKIAGTEDGLYYSDNNFGTWLPGNIILSPQLSDNSPSVSAFTRRIRNIETSTFLVAESNRWFYTSGGGIDWFALSGEMTANSITSINVIKRFKNLTWIGTNRGLYNDGNSLFSDGISFGLQTELESSSTLSTQLNISDISTGSSALYCCSENKIYRLLNGTWLSYKLPDVTTIHKIVLRESTKDWIIAISHNSIQIIDVTESSGVFG